MKNRSFSRLALLTLLASPSAISCSPEPGPDDDGSGGTGVAGSGGSSGTGGSTTAASGGVAGGGKAGTGGGAGSGAGQGGAGAAGSAGISSGGNAAQGGTIASGGTAGTSGNGAGGAAGASGGAGGLAGSAGSGGGGTAGSSGAGMEGASGEAAGGGSAGAGGRPAPGNPPVLSDGCGQPLGMLTAGSHTITSSNTQRQFTIDIPDDYDPDHPYRLIFAWHWINASDDDVVNGSVSNGGEVWAYYGLKRQADEAGEPAIFIAPQSRNGRWDQQDHVLFDDLLELAKNELCIDTTRVFATGFSFGGMQTYSLSLNHQQQLRAVSALAPANFNIYLPTDTNEPIAYMSTTGMSDDLCYWEGEGERGAKFAAIGHAEDNGCDVPDTIPTTTSGSRSHLCYDFTGCDTGYPVKACTFDGGHIAAHADGGTGDNGATTWMPEVTWEFFSQF